MQTEKNDRGSASSDHAASEDQSNESYRKPLKAGRRGGKIVLGDCVLAEQEKRGFSRAVQRMKDIDRLLHGRYGGQIPESDIEDDGFLFVMAHAVYCYYDHEQDRIDVLVEWLQKRAPWARGSEADLAANILRKMHPRRKHLRDGSVAKILNVRFSERQDFGITTISANDIKPAEMKRRLGRIKAEKAKARKANKRREAGAKPHGAPKPWVEAGVSKATYYRHLKAENETVSAPGGDGPNETISAPPCETLSAPVDGVAETVSNQTDETISAPLIVPHRKGPKQSHGRNDSLTEGIARDQPG